MKNILLLISLIISAEAVCGLPPTTLKGQSGTKATTFNFEVPHNQATKVSGAGLIETGNKNRLKNPGFESSVSPGADWDIATTGTAIHGFFGYSTNPIEGKNSLQFSCAGGASGGTCTISQDVVTKYAIDGMVSAYIKSDSATGVKLWKRIAAVNTLSKAIETTNTGLFKVPGVFGTTSIV